MTTTVENPIETALSPPKARVPVAEFGIPLVMIKAQGQIQRTDLAAQQQGDLAPKSAPAGSLYKEAA